MDESIARIAEQLDRDRREAAEAMTFGQRLLAGAALFDLSLKMMRAGIRMQFPDADAQRVEEIVLERLRMARRLEATMR